MKIIIKELPKINHIYLFDQTMRPLFMDIVSKRNTKSYIKKMIKKYDIIDFDFVKEIDLSNTTDSFRGHI
jgi:hypothetical protein